MPQTHTRASRIAVGLTYICLWAEHIVLAFWPAMAVGLLALGIGRLFNPSLWVVEGLWFAFAAFAVSGLWALWYAIRKFHLPKWGIAIDRVDAQFPDRPLHTLDDTQAIGADDPAARDLWNAHLAGMEHAG